MHAVKLVVKNSNILNVHSAVQTAAITIISCMPPSPLGVYKPLLAIKMINP